MTFQQHLANKLKLTAATSKPDKLDARLLVLHNLEKRDEAQQREYEVLLKAARAKFKAAELERKAKASLEKRDEADRKADAHAKILIGVAAIELAKKTPKLRDLLAPMAGAMPSARKDLINKLLGVEIPEVVEATQPPPPERAEASKSGEPVSLPLFKEAPGNSEGVH